MGQPNKPYFEVACKKHGKHLVGFGGVTKFLKVGENDKRKQGCPHCKREYLKNNTIKETNIDWRYVNFG